MSDNLMRHHDNHPVHVALPTEDSDAATVAQTPTEDIHPASVRPSIGSFAPYLERQGLYIHSFQCMACSLEFALFSWWPDRHSVTNTACPECMRVTQKSHWRADVITQPGLLFGQEPEIYHYSPVGPNPQIMMDSSIFTGLPEDSGEGTWPDLKDK